MRAAIPRRAVHVSRIVYDIEQARVWEVVEQAHWDLKGHQIGSSRKAACNWTTACSIKIACPPIVGESAVQAKAF